MSKTYKNPPIIEAVCELRFSNSEDYTAEALAAFSKELASLLPKQKSARRNEVEVNVDNKTGQQEVKRRVFEFPQFLSVDEKYIVQIESTRLSIHRLKPYVAWQDFYPLIQATLAAYANTLGRRSLARIGLRYINHIELTDSPDKSFNLKIVLPDPAKGEIVSSFVGVVESISPERDMLRISLGDRKEDGQGKVYILDIDCFRDADIEEREYGDWITMAHQKVEDAFESIVATHTKDKFDTP